MPSPANLPEATIDTIIVKSPEVCHLLRLPLELRELLYRMLLTTQYCTHLASKGVELKFHLHPGILLLNRQVSAEATKILYQENDFIILKVSGVNLRLKFVPKFERLSEKKVTSPLLRINIAAADRILGQGSDQQTVITTLEGLQSIICTIWTLENYPGPHVDTGRVYHRDVSLTLDCNIKAKARCKALSDLILKPWDKVNGFKELILTGDITEPMREHLKKYNLEGPFPSEVAARLRDYHSLAARKFRKGDFLAGRWRWTTLDTYWNYLYHLQPYRLEGHRMCERGNDLWNVLKESLPMYFEGKLELVTVSLLLKWCNVAVSQAQTALSATDQHNGWTSDFDYELPHHMQEMFKAASNLYQLRSNPQGSNHEAAQ
jgi:hypothetical protein